MLAEYSISIVQMHLYSFMLFIYIALPLNIDFLTADDLYLRLISFVFPQNHRNVLIAEKTFVMSCGYFANENSDMEIIAVTPR